MTRFSKVAILTICTALTPLTPAMADAETTAVMEELFEVMWATAGVAEVGNKDDANRLTRWSDVVISDAAEGAPTINLPWIEVSKNLFGGYTVTMAPQIDITGKLPEETGEFSGTIRHSGFEVDVKGTAMARTFEWTFGSVDVDIKMGDIADMTMTLRDGNAQTELAKGVMTGAFDYPAFDINYKINIEGQNTDTQMSLSGMKGTYRYPVLKGNDLNSWQAIWSAGADFYVDYVADGMTAKMAAASPMGPVNVETSGGAMAGRMAARDGTMSSAGTLETLVYNVSAAGMPPMKVTIDKTESLMAFPLDNVDNAKPAQLKMALNGLELDPAIWAMFDPQGLLPQDKANLEIDLSGDVKWAQKIADFDPKTMATRLPVQFENVKVTALNLNALGATVTTTGAFDINSAKFPPTASGTADVSIQGANTLMDNLTKAGLLPAQNAMMAKGMMGVFFKQGGEGLDHFVSQILIAPDGSISANGFPLK